MSKQSEYNRALYNLRRRIKYWEKKKHISVDIPKKPKKITQASIEKLQKITLKNLSKSSYEKAKERYEEKYETGEFTRDLPYYTPPSEQDFIDNAGNIPFNYHEEEDEEEESTPEYSQEFDAWVNDLIDSTLNTSGINFPNADAKEMLYDLINSARFAFGNDEQFYNFLNDPNTIEELQKHAFNAMATSPEKDGSMKPSAAFEIVQFAQILNANRPLTGEQQDSIFYHEGTNFDYSDIFD